MPPRNNAAVALVEGGLRKTTLDRICAPSMTAAQVSSQDVSKAKICLCCSII